MKNGKKNGEHAPAAAPAAKISDIEAVGAVLAEEKLFCSYCGLQLRLWPPEEMPRHVHGEHPETLWPAFAKIWDDYDADTDLARRANFINNLRVSHLMNVLRERFDIYQKCVAAGAIIPSEEPPKE